MARQIRQNNRRSPRITKRTSGENNLEEEPRDADRDNTQVKDCEGHPHGIGRGSLAGDIELRQTTQAQSGYRGRSSNNNSPDGQSVFSKHGIDYHKLHR